MGARRRRTTRTQPELNIRHLEHMLGRNPADARCRSSHDDRPHGALPERELASGRAPQQTILTAIRMRSRYSPKVFALNLMPSDVAARCWASSIEETPAFVRSEEHTSKLQ